MTLLSINVNRWRSRPSRRSVMRLCRLPSRSAGGGLANIALLLTQYQCVFNNVMVIMGGSAGRGNFTPNAEFNIAIDPEAAAKVSTAGWRL
jgi:hypothetical protein